MIQSRVVGGVHLPATELHLADMMQGPKQRTVDGKLTYQYKKLEAALKHVTNRKLAIDIGGHVGLWSMWLVKEFKRVVAFEPVPEHRELFLLNVDMTTCTMLPYALGTEAKIEEMEIPLETTGNAHIAIGKRHPGTRHVPHPDSFRVVYGVEVRRLDSFPNLDDVGFIKIDVEGFERQVVEGGKELILRAKPIMVVEQKKNESAYGQEEDAARKLLESWGMKPIREISGDWIMGW